MHHLLSTRSRLLALLAVLLTAAMAHAAPTHAHAAAVNQCNGNNCVTMAVTMADGKEVDNPVDPADEADEPDEDAVVHLVADTTDTSAYLAFYNWSLEVVDLNGNVYANCGANPRCEVFVWNDKDGQLFFQQTFVPDQKASPATPATGPYGSDGHTVQFAVRIVDGSGYVITQGSYGVVFDEGPGKD
jgi:hypothetical protein